ncbi:sensor histidine kinase [Limimaricola soesokkakensis]|uniref:sensor histidine kinase n=1 Tax=Limimaricola soesokkakensis TaxID=1343159 RepID=UPI00351676E4
MIELSSAQSAPGLAELFEHSPACLGLFEAEEPFRVIAHNPAFQKVLDEPFRTNGVAGLTLPEFASNPDRVLAVYRQVAETGEPFVVERYRYDGLERGPTWWNWSLTPVRRDGRITSLVLTSVEVTEAVLAQQKLEAEIEARRDAEELLAGEQELFQRIVDIIPVMITMYDADKNLLLANREFERLAGWSTEEARAEPVFEICYPDPDYRAEVARFMESCQGWMDISMVTRNGQTLQTSWSNVRLSDDRQIGIGLDLTDRKAAEDALEHSRRELALERAFLEAVIETTPVGISVARDPQGKPPIINREARRMMEVDQLDGGLERYRDLPLRHLDGRRYSLDELAIIRALEHGEETTGREVIYDTSAGERRWIVNGRPLRDETGNVVAAITSFLDIEDRRRAEEARQLLVDELNHRVKNTLAIVQSIAVQSFRDLSHPQQAQSKFQARLRALAGAHDLLTKENWSNAMLSDVLTTALHACGIADGKSSQADLLIDTDERLTPKSAVSLSMALHELATNAIKHGSLSVPDGKLKVRCSTSRERPDCIRIDWLESNGPTIPTERKSGFGMRLLRSTVERELNGKLRIDFGTGGATCEIDLPRTRLGGKA